jgi:hypothetical protein
MQRMTGEEFGILFAKGPYVVDALRLWAAEEGDATVVAKVYTYDTGDASAVAWEPKCDD